MIIQTLTLLMIQPLLMDHSVEFAKIGVAFVYEMAI